MIASRWGCCCTFYHHPAVIFTNAVSSVAACNAPVAMVILGVLLGNISPKRMFLSKEAWLVGGVRLLLIPLLTVLLLKAFPGVPGEMRAALIIAAAAPVGSNLAVYVQRQGGDSPGCRRDGVPFHHLVHYHHAPGPAGFLTWAENRRGAIEMSEKMAIEQRVEREITARMEELDQKLVAEKLERYRRLNQFAQLGKVLFVGSSLMEQFPINELLLDMGRTYTVYNRGIGGYTTQQLAKSLDVCVYELQPSQVLINIGTNDMNTQEYTVEGLMERYEAILRDIQAHVPGVKLTLLAYYPLCEPKLAEDPHGREILKSRNNRIIAQANQAVQALAKKVGAGFLNCNSAITDESGNMRPEYTIEGMHMYGDGYAQVLKALLPWLDEAAASSGSRQSATGARFPHGTEGGAPIQ